ncbi:HNH endonuclease [Nannocystis pusilla]|uniref:HNH endonuclease n=1 Tax=Nannocystis pusilla TaxID=889268 RepID=A0A9X3IYA0_9BACT|nr:HNH endonuclease [Nannocystis pusilla]MCY1009312.1 HNH endonuclease [Nannocystis pusilla]
MIVYSKRYGDVDAIWRRTNGKCHLCHEGVGLHTYGCLSLYGGEAGSVDHLVPQYFGGTDHFDNLRIAHQRCNSGRGIRDPDEVRLELAGRLDEPRSAGQEVLRAVAITGGGAAVGGLIALATADPVVDETSRQRARNRVIAGSVAGGLLCLLAALATR